MEREEFVKKFAEAAIESGEWIPLIILGAMFFGFNELPERIGGEEKQVLTNSSSTAKIIERKEGDKHD